jgi:ABC-type bacteriocin/lantibiotic exporter with double-glycine peptidase domain
VTARAALAALLLVGATGCASFGGRSQPFDATRLDAGGGWIVAAGTPVVRQAGSQDCGAACLAMVAGRWRARLSLEEATAALPTAAPGTSLGALRDLARARGLTAFAVDGDRDLLLHELGAGRPVVVGLLVPVGLGRAKRHYEVAVAAHPVEDRFVTVDPASGWRVRSWTDLDAEWLPAGRPTLVVIGTAPPMLAVEAVATSEMPTSPK